MIVEYVMIPMEVHMYLVYNSHIIMESFIYYICNDSHTWDYYPGIKYSHIIGLILEISQGLSGAELEFYSSQTMEDKVSVWQQYFKSKCLV